MNYFLAKSDPDTYSIEDLKKDKKTVWDGVHNYSAINYIKTMKKGDMFFIYHSQGENAIVGAAKIAADAYPNLNDSRPSWVVDIEFIKKFSNEDKITLKEIKDSHLFDDWMLVKNSRLSTMSMPVEFVKWGKLMEKCK